MRFTHRFETGEEQIYLDPDDYSMYVKGGTMGAIRYDGEYILYSSVLRFVPEEYWDWLPER